MATAELDVLDKTWSRPRTFLGWFSDVSHRSIGIRYILTAGTFFVLAGVTALVMRVQLAVPDNRLVGAERYDQMFTMHGATMMFLFAVPVMQGLAVYLVPLMIGARELSFPRLNAFGYWCYLIGGTAIWLGFIFNKAPDAGWFNYPPLSSSTFSPGINIDLFAVGVPLIEVSSVVGAVELLVTILGDRAAGMSINRMPLFVWAVLVMAVTIIIAFPPLILAGVLLELDRTVSTHFFTSGGGGDPLLWQHLFWFFGHPEVYVMLLPGLGIVSTIVATFSRRRTVGYLLVALSFTLIGAISLGVWVHHMFTTGRSPLAMSFFSAATLSIVIPSGIQVFSVLATLRHGRIRLTVPLLFAVGFVFVFVIGGLTGVQVASIPFDWQVHDTYFVVAHFHYTLLGGVVLPLLGGIYYWFPKFTGRMLDDRLGFTSFILIFIGINVTFFPLHIAGLDGMPRRVYTYPEGLGWDGPQAIASVGAFVLAAGVLVYLANLLWSARAGAPAGPNPWDAPTLEWLPDSPPPQYGFARPPVVRDAYPLWDKQSGVPGPQLLAADRRETLGTGLLDAQPEQRAVEPGPTIVPFVTAASLAVALLGLMFDPLWVPVGLLLIVLALVTWTRPTPEEWDMDYVRAGPPDAPPTSWVAESQGIHPPILNGVLSLALVLGVMLATLLSGYYYTLGKAEQWPLGGLGARSPWLGLIAVVLVVFAAVALALGRRGVRRGAGPAAVWSFPLAALLAVAAIVLVVVDLNELDYNWATNATGSVEWVLTGFMLLLTAGLAIAAAAAAVYASRGFFNPERFSGLTAVTWLGYFVAGAWLPVFLTIYVAPHMF
jgi:cytochrome c oxidase subunit I+III